MGGGNSNAVTAMATMMPTFTIKKNGKQEHPMCTVYFYLPHSIHQNNHRTITIKQQQQQFLLCFIPKSNSIIHFYRNNNVNAYFILSFSLSLSRSCHLPFDNSQTFCFTFNEKKKIYRERNKHIECAFYLCIYFF